MKLSRNVPERDVYCADTGHHGALASVITGHVIHAMPEHFDVERVGTDEQGLQRLVDYRGRDLRRLESLRKGFAPARDAFISEDFEQRGRALFHPALRKCEGFGHRAFQYADLQVGYFHRYPFFGGSHFHLVAMAE